MSETNHPGRSFPTLIREALNLIQKPAQLGEKSLLASPYFLASYFSGSERAADDRSRGRQLIALLQAAAEDLWPGQLPKNKDELLVAVAEERLASGNKGRRYRYLLLELRFFRHYILPRDHPRRVLDMQEFLNVSESRFFVHLEEAIEALAHYFLERVQPTFRLEKPTLAAQLFGRDSNLALLNDHLASGATVSLSGVGGIGKSTLGATVHRHWPGQMAFWYTFRPGLNDDLPSLLFSLGHFLQLHGAQHLWQQLHARAGEALDTNLALGLLREDLALLPAPPLLCFDEVDLLHTSERTPRRANHILVLEFLDTLRGLAPILFIGQRPLLDTDYQLSPKGLGEMDIRQMLAAAGMTSADDPLVAALRRASGGNPRLLELFIALQLTGVPEDALLESRGQAALKPLFHRLWKRLDTRERALLGYMAVFRNACPVAGLLEREQETLIVLQQRRLVHLDEAQGGSILPVVQSLIYAELPPAVKETLHSRAARLRYALADYTAAAYHWLAAGQPGVAIQTWYEHMEEEIRRGKGGAALALFTTLQPDTVATSEGQALVIMQARLYLLVGEAEKALAGLETFSWEPDEALAAEALRLAGNAHQILGDTYQALDEYSQAIAQLSRTMSQITQLHWRIGQMHFRHSELAQADRELLAARMQVALFEATLAMMRGHFTEAEPLYEQARALATQLGDDKSLAQTYYQWTALLGRQNEIEAAEAAAYKAMALFEKLGDRVMVEGTRADIAGWYLNVRQFEKTIGPGEEALRFFEGIKYDRRISSLCNNLAEAYCELGQTARARELAGRVLQMEHPRALPNAFYTLGRVNHLEGTLETAEHSFQEGIRIAI
ncbi:MAG: ATP-binding protein, partial [Anaerolineales bacterium]|nr:ATP-binding protein [Anaerolineales bacterium]